MMMMMVMVTMIVNVCDDDCYLMLTVILVNEVMSCDVSPVAMFLGPQGPLGTPSSVCVCVRPRRKSTSPLEPHKS